MMLAVEQLGLGRGGRMVLRQIEFVVQPGWALQIHGPNGSGKTTLLRLLAGLLAPSTGVIRWDGADTRAAPARWRSTLSYVAHANGVSDDLTVQEHLNFAAALSGVALRGAAVALTAALEGVGLERQRHMRAGQLSQGQRRRVALARLVLERKPLWLLDEPAAALDHTASAWLHEMLATHLQTGGIVVASTHQPLSTPTSQTQCFTLERTAQ
ncbi:cytochrome c biogenesis heme-transporting ATPase CcmA [Paraburkholderia bonniea]|uniref:cytochrome c biogenesis heme-transporting ATPase CcmA n=1 Tax=Paraburkholderia bonniea TaxID=2152891 RepID=UPI001FE6B057|nr:cytochrome c biogenesis heme-transporting ATPase CcmA [Paraburkholderia bonniea]WJF91953.1 cytochrome c biogenesis heme-transporting ATPase CcmA [Paraburkholderia bonniea]WJF95272.1 cytochrome c biogenesis heme-transporting ATPase CcmA [Paraburkholderia bonniea]